MLIMMCFLWQKKELLAIVMKYFCLIPILTHYDSINSNKAMRFINTQEQFMEQNLPSSKYVFIDKTGASIIDVSKYDDVKNFSDGLAAVHFEDKGWGFIDTTGKVIIEPQFQDVGHFSEGLVNVRIGEKFGFIDRTGFMVINPLYDVANSFSEGVASVEKGDEVFLINKIGERLFSHSLNKLHFYIHESARFSEGLIAVHDCEKDKTGFIDKTGLFVIEARFSDAGTFSDGIARVAVFAGDDEKIAYINHEGQFIIPPKFNTDGEFRRNSTDFSEGLASLSEGLQPTVTEEEKFVYIDKKGDVVLSTNFFYAGSFRGGMAMVYDAEKNKMGFIDKLGKVVIPLQYDLASDFSEGMACVRF